MKDCVSWNTGSQACDWFLLQLQVSCICKAKNNSLPYFKSLILIGRFSWETKMLLYVKSLKYCLLGSLTVCGHLVSAALEMHLSIFVSCTWHILKGSEPSSNFFVCHYQMSWATSHLAPKLLLLIIAERQKLVWYCWSQSLLLLVNCCLCVTSDVMASPFTVCRNALLVAPFLSFTIMVPHSVWHCCGFLKKCI